MKTPRTTYHRSPEQPDAQPEDDELDGKISRFLYCSKCQRHREHRHIWLQELYECLKCDTTRKYDAPAQAGRMEQE